MHMFRIRSVSARKRKIWLSVGATVLGTVALTQLGLWVQAARNTDLSDRTVGITADDLKPRVEAAPLRFRDVAAELGIVMRHGPGPRHRFLPEDTGSGLAWGDCDGDGDFDLYVVNFSTDADSPESAGHSRLFRNDGDRFTDITDSAGVSNGEDSARGRGKCMGMGASWADYDGDGDIDLLVTNYGGPNRLYRNRGDATFEDVAVEAGVAASNWSTGAAWGDFDRDGHLDLYVCNYVEYDEMLATADIPASRGIGAYTVPFALNPNSFDPAPNCLYRNRGDGTFEDVTDQFDVANADGRSLAATFVDLDGDGWLDLYVANDVSPNMLYHNMLGVREGSFYHTLLDASQLRQGQPFAFVDLSAITGAADSRGSMGLSVGETGAMNDNLDGLPDLFLTHWVAQENALYQSLPLADDLLEYRDKTREFRLGEISLPVVGWGCGFCDLDLDGRPDLVVANGNTLEHREDPSRLIAEPVFVFWNDGKQFQEIAAQTSEALRARYGARGLAIADFNDDGLPDVAISVNRGQPLLLRNETVTEHRFLKIRLRGRSAVCFGAKVDVSVGGKRQIQWWGADVSFLSQHAPELIFGLGTNATADEIHITWADGQTTNYASVPAPLFEALHPE
ncbi:MAG: CRTAC1 family protein [Pirellulaceae bacterium]